MNDDFHASEIPDGFRLVRVAGKSFLQRISDEKLFKLDGVTPETISLEIPETGDGDF
jgi:hypothetical protein